MDVKIKTRGNDNFNKALSALIAAGYIDSIDESPTNINGGWPSTDGEAWIYTKGGRIYRGFRYDYFSFGLLPGRNVNIAEVKNIKNEK